MASIDEFRNLDLRVGVITGVEDHPTARKPMYKLEVDLGSELGKRTVVAGIKNSYTREELLGKKVICVANLEPKSVAGIESQGMLLAAEDSGVISLLTIDRDLPQGSAVR